MNISVAHKHKTLVLGNRYMARKARDGLFPQTINWTQKILPSFPGNTDKSLYSKLLKDEHWPWLERDIAMTTAFQTIKLVRNFQKIVKTSMYIIFCKLYLLPSTIFTYWEIHEIFIFLWLIMRPSLRRQCSGPPRPPSVPCWHDSPMQRYVYQAAGCSL